MPTCLKLKINFTIDRSSVECTKFLSFRDQMAIEIGIMFTGITFSRPEITAMGPNYSVLCHVVTGSLVSHHGLRKYWHFVLYEINPTLCIQAKREKQKGRRSKSFVCFKDNRLKAKEYETLISSKKKICRLIADLYAL